MLLTGEKTRFIKIKCLNLKLATLLVFQHDSGIALAKFQLLSVVSSSHPKVRYIEK